MEVKKPTRGFGLLEKILAKKRAGIAENLIDEKFRSGRILDVGCGLFPYFLVSTKFKEKHGLDSVINKNEFKGEKIFLKQIDIEKNKMPYNNNYFDTVIMLAVFEHINPDRLDFVIKEIFRVLRKDGIFILTTPSPWSVPILWLLSRIKIISKVEIDDHKSSYDINNILNLVCNAGFLRKNTKKGFFEFFLNMWIVAKK